MKTAELIEYATDELRYPLESMDNPVALIETLRDHLTEAATALEAATPRTAAAYDALWGMVAESQANGEPLAVWDASHRFWIIDGDEDGNTWAVSFENEGDDRPLPCLFENAPIRYPATILRTPEAH